MDSNDDEDGEGEEDEGCLGHFGSLVLTVVEEMLANSLRVNCCLVCDLPALLKQTRNAYCKLFVITGVF